MSKKTISGQTSSNRTAVGFAMIVAAACGMVETHPANADNLYGTPGSAYAAQQTAYYCGEGAMQMMLSATAVSTANPGFAMPSQKALYIVAQNVQYIASGFTIPGTLPSGMANGPGFPGALPAAAPGNGWSQYINSSAAYDAAERNIAAAIATTQIPVAIAVHGGQHWDAVWGVETAAGGAAPAPGAVYTINGFDVADPWTGFALANKLPTSVLGDGVSYFSNQPTQYLARNGTITTYNPFLAQLFTPLSPAWSGTIWGGRYVSVADPLSTQPPTPSTGAINSIPGATEITLSSATEITPAQAITDAVNDESVVNLSEEIGFSKGDTVDSNTADILQVAETPGSSVEDYLVPFEDPNGKSGSNYTGIMDINPYTGQIDIAMSIPSTADEMTLAQIQAFAEDTLTGNLPADMSPTPTPEPGALVLLVGGVGTLLLLRRKNSS
jgi:hypothetical protein